MNIFDGTKFSLIAEENKRLFQELLPELVKRLILNGCTSIKNIRIPGMNDVWAPGFDGVIENAKAFKYVCEGKSVWEFGTDHRSLAKIESDYSKRTNNPLGVDKASTEFYLVSPYIWAHDSHGVSLTSWEASHTGDWKNVHLYDASILADWINSEPAVCAWLIETINCEKGLGFSSISSAWNRFSSKTSPPFSHSLFLEGRDIEKNNFAEHLDHSITKVKSDTTVDAYGFCLSSILEHKNIANSVIVVNNQSTYTQLSRLCCGKTFLLNFKLDCDVIEGNHVILCYNKEATAIQADIELASLPKSSFDKAINDMGLSFDLSNSLYRQTHGNLLSLIRKIPGTSSDSCPKWATQDHIDFLAPMLILQNYDVKNIYDQSLISYLAHEDYTIIEERYNAWLRLEDAPIKRVNNHIILINYEEAWDVLKLSPSSQIFNRFINVICNILSHNKYLDNDNSLLIDSRAECHLHNLFLNIVYFASVADEIETVYESVRVILNTCPLSNLLLKNLPLLAEATPPVVMEYLQSDVKSPSGRIIDLFVDSSISSEYCKILFALDELVLHDETRVAACDFLFDLCLKTQETQYHMSNSPRESLLNALCLWNSHTALTISEKVKLTEKYSSINRAYMSSFLIDLLFKDSIFFGVRDSTRVFPEVPVDIPEWYDATNDIANRLFQYYNETHNIAALKKLLGGYSHFSNDVLITAANTFSSSNYTLEELVSLNYELRKKFYYSKLTLDNNSILGLNAWIKCTTPTDDIGQIGWIFYDYYHCFMPESHYEEKTNLLELNEITYQFRKNKLDNLIQSHSAKEILQLVHFSKDEFPWGTFYAPHFTSDSFMDFASEAHRCKKFQLLSGLLDLSSLEDCIKFLDTLKPEDQYIVISNLSRRDIASYLDSSEKEHSYWLHQIMREYDEDVYQKLLIYNPFNLLPYFAYIQEDDILVHIEKIKEVFRAIITSFSSAKNYSSLNPYAMDKIIDDIDQKNYDSKDWALLCADLYDLRLLHDYPNTLKNFYFKHPYLLCNKLIESESNFYSQFNYHYELPDNAYHDLDTFMFFVNTLVEKHYEHKFLLSILGNILGKSIDGSDGIFPHEYVRIAMEQHEGVKLNHKVFIGKINSRGLHSVGDGTAEKNIAEEYRNNAKKFDIEFPQTSQLLRWLSDSYIYEGKHHQLYSEIGENM